jgi:hypothetical protein
MQDGAADREVPMNDTSGRAADGEKSPDEDVSRVGSGTGPAVFAFQRGRRLFAQQGDLVRRIEKKRVLVQLAPDQLFHASVPCDGAVRLGKLRVSEIMPDGHEVTRGVLQAGVVFTTRSVPVQDAAEAAPSAESNTIDAPDSVALSDPKLAAAPPAAAAPSPAGDAVGYDLDATILMALGETELWIFPAGCLDGES